MKKPPGHQIRHHGLGSHKAPFPGTGQSNGNRVVNWGRCLGLTNRTNVTLTQPTTAAAAVNGNLQIAWETPKSGRAEFYPAAAGLVRVATRRVRPLPDEAQP
jgi:hypothetical protein